MDEATDGTVKRRRTFPKLIIRENGKERIVELTHKITSIGRAPDNVVEIDDITPAIFVYGEEGDAGGVRGAEGPL
mgnify:CR=1 FL=1